MSRCGCIRTRRKNPIPASIPPQKAVSSSTKSTCEGDSSLSSLSVVGKPIPTPDRANALPTDDRTFQDAYKKRKYDAIEPTPVVPELSPLQKCFAPLWPLHRYYYGCGNAIDAILKTTNTMSERLDELFFGKRDNASKLVIHSCEELGCRFNPTEHDFPPTEPGQLRTELTVSTADPKEVPKSSWSLLGGSGASQLDMHLQLSSRQEFLTLFINLTINLHNLPIGTWVMDVFPELSKLEFVQGTVSKTRRTDGLIEISADASWHPNLKNRYLAVYHLLTRLEHLEFALLSDSLQHIATAHITSEGLSVNYVINNFGLLVSFDSPKMKKVVGVSDFHPRGKTMLYYDMNPRIKLKELGCGSLKLAPVRGTITYSGSDIIGGPEDECRFVIKVTEVGAFPFETMLRPFLDTAYVRKLIVSQFHYEARHKKSEDGSWILHTYFRVATPSFARPLVRCLRSFALNQFQRLDFLRLLRDGFLFMGADMLARCQFCQGAGSNAPCYGRDTKAQFTIDESSKATRDAPQLHTVCRPKLNAVQYSPRSISVRSSTGSSNFF